MSLTRCVVLSLCALSLVVASTVSAQDPIERKAYSEDPNLPKTRPGGAPPGSPPSLPEGMSEEQMWTIPTEEDWAKPVLIQFQRTWEDALAVSRETERPILICINMDGEIASEHYAGIKYRDPEYAKLFEPYVCVVASVYRHNPKDHDEAGRRILCPRLGSVTCGEHIALEPILFEQYMDGQRISPRHIMVELDGKERYDVFHTWDLDTVFTLIREGIEKREHQPRDIARGDRSILERVDSRDIGDRIAVEDAYRTGDAKLREDLLRAAAEHAEAAPVGLLRMGVYDVDPALVKSAREALAKVTDPSAVGLLGDALSTPAPDSDREALLAALERIAPNSERAQLLATVHRGLSGRSGTVRVTEWQHADSGGGTYAPPTRAALEGRLDASEAALREAEAPTPEAALELAVGLLELAVDPEHRANLLADPRNGRRFLRVMLEDARLRAEQARDLGADDWRVAAVLGQVAWEMGDKDAAFEHAFAAMEKAPAQPDSWLAVATLALFAQARQEAIYAKLRAKEKWPREWVADVDSAYAVLAAHPLGTDRHVAGRYDFLNWLGAKGRAGRALESGLERFPNSWVLHDRNRSRILDREGVKGLEPAYDRMLAEPDASPDLPWFAGLTSIIAAEFHRRAGDAAAARGAYGRAVAHFDRAIEANPDSRESSDHYVALALAGEARLALEAAEIDRAVDLLVAALARHAQATDDQDGLGISPAMTILAVRAKLEGEEFAAARARLDAATAAVDPELLVLPPSDPPPRRRGGRRRGR